MKAVRFKQWAQPRMIPMGGGGTSLQNTENLSQRGEATSGGGSAAGGFRLSPVVTVATGGSRATASPDAGGSLPTWVWIGGLALGALYLTRRK